LQLRDVDAELESLYYVDEGSRSRHKLIFTGKKKFNQDPMRGIEYLTDRGLLSRQPGAVAQWLYKGEGLSKTAIGELLGSHDPFCLEVLDQFVLCHTFQNMFIVDALRAFLWSFRLPGESQKIDRIMERFAQQYVATNEGVFDTADTCYTIAYSCIMLNTLLHNPNVKDRPTFERYQNMNKELLDAGSVNTALLAQIFDSIRTREFQIPCEDAARLDNIFLHPDREGWLYKQSSSQFISGPLSWKRRWFVLSDSCLYYFDQSGEKEPRGIIPLQNVGVRRVENASRPFMFEIFSLSEDGRIKACKTEQTGKLVEGRHSVYRICASSSDDLNAWLEAIAGAVTHYPTRPRSAH
ncbi:Sec7 domain protein, partial [Oesophagostomum dentatum]